MNWIRDGNEPADSSEAPAEDGSCAQLRLQLDPDAFVPAFEAKGLADDRPVVVSELSACAQRLHMALGCTACVQAVG